MQYIQIYVQGNRQSANTIALIVETTILPTRDLTDFDQLAESKLSPVPSFVCLMQLAFGSASYELPKIERIFDITSN
jgi:hypothetical protein